MTKVTETQCDCGCGASTSDRMTLGWIDLWVRSAFVVVETLGDDVEDVTIMFEDHYHFRSPKCITRFITDAIADAKESH